MAQMRLYSASRIPRCSGRRGCRTLALSGNGAGVWMTGCTIIDDDIVLVGAAGTTAGIGSMIVGGIARGVTSVKIAGEADTIGSMIPREGVGGGRLGVTGVIGYVETGEGPGSTKAKNSTSGGVLVASAHRPNLDQVIDSWVSRSRVIKCGRFHL